jgi:hypothetical protein
LAASFWKMREIKLLEEAVGVDMWMEFLEDEVAPGEIAGRGVLHVSCP